MHAILILLGAVAAVLILSRIASNLLWSLLGSFIYTIILWPGVVVHELSHLLGAVLTFTRVRSFSLLPKDVGNSRVFGSVGHERTRNPIKLVVISALPLFLGAFLISWLSTGWLPLPAPAFRGTSLTGYLAAWLDLMIRLMNILREGGIRELLGVYFLIAIAAHLSPSNQDLKYTAFGIGALALLGFLWNYGSSRLGFEISLLPEIENGAGRAIPVFSKTIALMLPVMLGSGILLFLKRAIFR